MRYAQLYSFDFDRAHFELGNLRHRVNGRAGQGVGGHLGKVEVHEHHATRQRIREVRLARRFTAAGRDPNHITGDHPQRRAIFVIDLDLALWHDPIESF